MRNFMKIKHLSAPWLLNGLIAIPFLLLIASFGATQSTRINTKDRYLKTEYRVPMRDGKKLYTIVYTPRDVSQKYPILIQRSPYGAQPYGGDAYRASLGPSPAFMEEGYIFV